jgi:rhodanese-related sulfurtransferase
MVKGLTADNLEAILTGADPTQPVVIDVRPTSSFIRGHLAGSLSVPYRTG